ncbi:MAG: BamA/TamA family outer membrane protein [Bernardetiaceae bacterium]|nr:BamA/TamA family outer membrane protein [Bernardetiaceae bacterium]
MLKWLFRLSCLCILLHISMEKASAQSFIGRYINNFIKDTSDIAKPQFLVYPTLAYSPETSWEIGLSTLQVFYANRDTTNRLSEINGFTFFTLENQYGLWFDQAIYTHEDKWFFLGRTRLQSFPLFYYGIGMDTPSEYTARVDANQILLKQRVLRKVKKDFFIGLELDFQRISRVNFVPADEANPPYLPLGAMGSNNFGVGLGIVYDNRHNVLNVRDGFFSELGFLHYSPHLSTFRFNTLISDTRIFRPVGRNNVLAGQLLGQFSRGDVPFNQLALMGGESMMRGYYTGRFRDNNQIAAQAEMRFLPLPLGFSKRIGASVFGSMATVFDRDFSAQNFVWAGGAGLRFLVFPKKDIFTRVDFALTKEGNGLYIFIGESF